MFNPWNPSFDLQIVNFAAATEGENEPKEGESAAVKDGGGIKAIKGSRARKTELNKYRNWVSVSARERLLGAALESRPERLWQRLGSSRNRIHGRASTFMTLQHT